MKRQRVEERGLERQGPYKELFDKYPQYLFNKDSNYAMQLYGFQVSKQWFEPIKKLFDGIHSYLQENPVDNFWVAQVKEKYGYLRVYYRGRNPDGTAWIKPIDDLIQQAEQECSVICEFCGKPGTVHSPNKRWVHCACPDHSEQLKTKLPRDLDNADY